MYRFKLEALLNQHQHQKETSQKELALAQRKFFEEREKLNQKKKEKLECLENLQAKKKESTNVSDILLHMNFIQQLSKDVEKQAMRAQKTARIVDQKRQELVAIMQKHKTLKKLKTKEQKAYQQKLMKNERKLMDEQASIRHIRKL